MKADKARKDAIKNAIRVSDVLVEAVNGGVEECYINQKRIELEIQALSSTILRFAKHTDQWLAASRSLNNAVKVFTPPFVRFIVIPLLQLECYFLLYSINLLSICFVTTIGER